MFRRWLLAGCCRMAGAGLLMTLTACSTTYNYARDPAKDGVRADEATVVVSLTTNTPQVDSIDGIRVLKLQPPGVDKKEHYQLKQIAIGMAQHTSMFAAVLPPGEYVVDELNHFASQRFLKLTDVQRERIGSFAVRAGESVDLGRLIVTPANTRVLVGRSARAGDNVELLKRFAPEYAALFKGGSAPGWSRSRHEKDQVEEYAMERPTGALGMVESQDGRVFAASRLGTVLVRSPEGRWSAVRTGRLESLLYAKPVDIPDTRLVAVGEFATLVRLPTDGQRLEVIDPGNLPKGSAHFLAGGPDVGWFIAMRHGNEVKVMHSMKLAAGDWRQIRSESVAHSFWNGPNALWFWPTAGGFAYASAEGKLSFYDYASGQWQDRDSPGKNRFLGVSANPNGIGVLTSPGGGLGGAFGSQFLSRDEGRTWKEVPSGEVKIRVIPPLPMPRGELVMVGGVFSNPSLYLSKDDGKAWARQGETRLAQFFFVTTSGVLMAVDQGNSGLFAISSSSDQGKTWSFEYSNYDRRIGQ